MTESLQENIIFTSLWFDDVEAYDFFNMKILI